MAAVKHMRGVKLLVKIGDGASPEVFSVKCSINADRGISFSANTTDYNVPDCDDPDLMAWIVREKVALSGDISGAGMLNTPDTQFFFDWMADSLPKNVRVYLDGVSGADGGGYWAGSYHCAKFDLTGGVGKKAEVSISLVSTGAVTWTLAA